MATADEQRVLVYLGASAPVHATHTRLVRALPSEPAQLAWVLEPKERYAPSKAPPIYPEFLQDFHGALYAADEPDATPGALESIDVELVVLDRFGNDACDALMAPHECAHTDKGWRVALTLVHEDHAHQPVEHVPVLAAAAQLASTA